jgi:hypothetical protein
MEHEKIDPDQKTIFLATQSDADRATLTILFDDSKTAAGRDVLAFAARFPLILFAVFGLIALWFRSRGGYKPVEL